MTTTLTIDPDSDVKTHCVCLTSSRFYSCQQTDTGWTACSVSGNATAVFAACLPHQSAALAVLWQVVLKSNKQLTWVNQAFLPDDSTQLKQVIAQLQPDTTETLILECFSPYHAHSRTMQDLGTALTALTQLQPIFPGALNGPTFTYQRLVNAAGYVLGECGNAHVATQFQQFTAACVQFDQELSECALEDVLPELV